MVRLVHLCFAVFVQSGGPGAEAFPMLVLAPLMFIRQSIDSHLIAVRPTAVVRNCLFGSSSPLSEFRDAWGLHERFDRWRWLQKLLDEETTTQETNRIIYCVVDCYLKYERPKHENTDETGSPELTPRLRSRLQAMIDRAVDNSIPILLDDVEKTVDLDLLQKLEELLPTADEDEDGHKSTWDIVLQLHGVEAVKYHERNLTVQWRSRCAIARLLLYYDFLTYGLVDGPIL